MVWSDPNPVAPWEWRKKQIYSEAADGAGLFTGTVLTLKGLEVLNSVPQELKGEKSLGERIGKALKDGSTEVIKSLILQLVHKRVEALSGYSRIKPRRVFCSEIYGACLPTDRKTWIRK